MRAAGLTDYGGPGVLHVVELPDPEPGRGELLIRVHAATVNPTDTVLRSGARAERLKDVRPPHVPGMDAAGVLERIGAGTRSDLEVGERVMAIVLPLGQRGGYAERVVVPSRSAVRSPAGASDAEAATLPMNGLTARACLDQLALTPGQTLAVTGAAGAVGGYAVQLGKAAGLRVVADAAVSDEALVRSLGADEVVSRGEHFADHVRALVPDGADGMVDAALLDALAIPAVRDGGGIATLRAYDGTGDTGRGIRFFPVFVRTYAKEREKLDRLRAQAEDGTLTLRVARRLPLESAAEAHRLLEAGGVRGRLVLEL
jgi:NADPH:quinone reductase-like Zn-dependent oxidoreductase